MSNWLRPEQIGTVEVLATRIYALDAEAEPEGQVLTAVVEPGVFPLYEAGEARFWLLDGWINTRGITRVGDGMFVMDGSDESTGVPVRFPSRRLPPREWKALLAEPVAQEGHPEQRLRIEVVG